MLCIIIIIMIIIVCHHHHHLHTARYTDGWYPSEGWSRYTPEIPLNPHSLRVKLESDLAISGTPFWVVLGVVTHGAFGWCVIGVIIRLAMQE